MVFFKNSNNLKYTTVPDNNPGFRQTDPIHSLLHSSFFFFSIFPSLISGNFVAYLELHNSLIELTLKMGNSSPQKQRKIKNVLPQTAEEKKEMKKPYIVKPCPDILRLQVGKEYDYCNCGLSKTQPFCDGSHEGTKFTPIKFTATQSLNILCLCKRSKNGPFCDNEHKKYHSVDF